MNVRFKKLSEKAVLPKHAKDGDAGLDLVAVKIEKMDSYQNLHRYGIAAEIPKGYVGLLFPRSSICRHDVRLSNSVGVIDSSYRGEIKAVFDVCSTSAESYKEGERTAQLVIVPYVSIAAEWSEELTETDRGEGGYGHTGKE